MFDLIVVGAGPGGSSAARRAATLGLRTLLLDEEVFPRDKVCGGALSEHARSLLDFELPDEICERPLMGVRVRHGRQTTECRKSHRVATAVRRSAFDHYLVQKAVEVGAEARMGEQAVDFAEDRGGVEVRTAQGAYRAGTLVVAEGAQGQLRQRVQRPFRLARAIVLVAEVELPDAEIESRYGGVMETYFGPVPRGYGYVIPHRGYVNVGLGGLAFGLRGLKERMAKFLAARGFAGDHATKAHALPVGGLRRRLARRRVLLCGDAAGFADGCTGEGLTYAVRSGQLAGEAAARIAGGQPPRKSAADYAARCRREFRANLPYSLIVGAMLYGGPGFVVRAGIRREGALDRVLDVVAGRATHRELVHWLVPRLPGVLLSTLRRAHPRP